MSTPLRERVLAFLGEHHVMTLATVGRDGPWAAAVFYAHDGLKLYFLSAPSSRHAECLAADPRVAATIQRDYDDWPGIRGLQISGTARAVAPADEARIRTLYQQRYPLVGGGAGVPRAIMEALNKIRWYELVPENVYLIDNTLGFAHREHLSPSSGD
jgi:uncharacterized protein YhbP (UPF0306 family)